MRLLNLCCGANRPQDEFWWNLDNLHDDLEPGTPERTNLDAEPRYINADVINGFFWKNAPKFDGILASHCLEHWPCTKGLKVMQECHRILEPGGVLMVSVPDASYFRLMHSADTAENAMELFGEPIFAPDGEETFLGYALWNRFHQAILTEDALWGYFIRAGFLNKHIERISAVSYNGDETCNELWKILNRRLFSLVMVGYKGL